MLVSSGMVTGLVNEAFLGSKYLVVFCQKVRAFKWAWICACGGVISSLNRVINYCFYLFVYIQTNTTNRTLYVLCVNCNMFWSVV